MSGIAVIIAAYNAERTIERAVRSALAARDRLSALNVVVVDDGSTDNTPALAALLGVPVLTQYNRGPASARNRGIEHAVISEQDPPDAILFLDADDELCDEHLPSFVTHLRRQLAAAGSQAPPAALVGAHLRVKEGNLVGSRTPDAAWVRAGFVDRAEALGTSHIFCTTGLFLTRVALEQGLRFDEHLRFAEDRDLIFRAGAIGPIAVSDLPVVRKHDEPGRMTSDPTQVRR